MAREKPLSSQVLAFGFFSSIFQQMGGRCCGRGGEWRHSVFTLIKSHEACVDEDIIMEDLQPKLLMLSIREHCIRIQDSFRRTRSCWKHLADWIDRACVSCCRHIPASHSGFLYLLSAKLADNRNWEFSSPSCLGNFWSAFEIFPQNFS